MHIISGLYKKRKLLFPKDHSLRPTQQRVREAIFDRLYDRVQGTRCLDLCSGTGAIGIEALSRGASELVFVDTQISWVQKNCTDLAGSYSIIKSDCSAYLKKETRPFDIIFFDPPWDLKTVYQEVLSLIFDRGLLSPSGLLICEHFKKNSIQEWVSDHPFDTRLYGDTAVSVITND